jgi:integrase
MENTAVLENPKRERPEYGKGGIRQLGPKRFQISFYDAEGRRRRESYSTQAKAEKMLATKLALKEVGKLDPVEGRVKVDGLAGAYKTYISNSKPKSHYWVCLVWRCHLEPFFGGKLAERVSSDNIEDYIDHRKREKASTSTINRELTILKAMFRRGMLSDPPKVNRVPRFPTKLREPNPRAGFVTDDQYHALQAKIPYAWLRALLAVAYNFGFRRGELVGLRVSQVDLKARVIHLLPGTTKNDKGRKVVMTAEVFELISECVKGKQPGDAVFTWADGTPVNDFRRSWRTIAKKAGFPGLLLHDMRRSAVRNMVRAGVSKHVAKRISGHTTDSIFDRYDIGDEADLVDAAQKIEARKNGHKLGTEDSGNP